MEKRNKGVIIFGIILLVLGLVASSYHELTPAPGSYCMLMAYPYLIIGLVLSLAGLVFIALGFLYSPRKTPPPTNPQQQKTN